MRKTSLLAALVLTTFSAAMVGCDDDDGLTDLDDDENFVADLTAAAEVPGPTGSPTATGTASIELDDEELTVTIVINGALTSPVTMAHIHGPALPGETANIILDFVPSMTTVINAGAVTGTIVQVEYDLNALPVSSTGQLRVPPSTLVNYLATGQADVNVHTVNNPTGELRVQIRLQ